MSAGQRTDMVDGAHARLRRLFDAAIELAPADRAAWIAQECAHEPELAKRLDAMLAAALDERFLADTSTRVTSRMDEAAQVRGEGPGTRLGPYTLVRSIGEGGFGTVFLAQQERPVARKVALKIIKLGMDTRQVVARFEQERQALAVMEHPNIARVIDAGATETGRPYFVMELVSGDPITQYCDQNELSIDERLDLFAQVCNAVQHAHQKGIIHRDLKPSNILVGTQDGRPLVKIIDFGIAKATAAKLTDKTLHTELRQVIGTLQYMSPEQAQGSLDIDTRTDVYALGVVLYELLTGSTPVDEATLRDAFWDEMQRIIREVEPPKPSTRLSRSAGEIASIAARRGVEPKRLGTIVRGELDWIVMKALEKDRARRYQSPSDLAADLKRHLGGEPVLAAPPNALYRVQKFVRRHRVGVTALALVLAAIVTGLGGTLWGLVQAKRGRAIAEQQSAIAREERAEADRQRSAAESARAQLQRVVDFQSKVLRRVKPFEMGRDLGLDLVERVRAAQSELPLEAEQRERSVTAFETLLGGISMTDAARRILDTNVLAPSSSAITAEFASEPQTQASLHTTVAETYQSIGLFEKALEEARRAFQLRLDHAGPVDRETLRAQVLVGILEWKAGHLEDSAKSLEDAVPNVERVFGPEDPDALTAQHCLAVLAVSRSRNDEALEILAHILPIQERTLGPDHAEVAMTLVNMGAALNNLSRWAEAATRLERALAIRRQLKGDRDERALFAQQLLAATYENLQRSDEANRLHVEAIETLAQMKGAKHPATIGAIAKLADNYQAQNRFEEALAEARRALDLRRAVLGDAHPDTIASLNSVGILCSNLGRHDEAEPLFAEAFERAKTAYGEDSQQAMGRASNLAVCYWYQGKFGDVEPIFRLAVEFDRRTHGNDDPRTAFALVNLAILVQRLGRLDESETLLEEALAINRTKLGPDHVQTLAAHESLATLAYQRGEFAQAEARFRELSATHRRVNGENDPLTLQNEGNLARTLRDLGRIEEAEAIFVSNLERRRAVNGATHPETLETLAWLATTYADSQRLDAARPLIAELLAGRRAAAEEPDANPAALERYADLLLDCPLPEWRDPTRALACARRAYELTRGENPASAHTLAKALFATGDAADAVETLRTLLAKLPPEAPDRETYEKDLAEFEAALERR